MPTAHGSFHDSSIAESAMDERDRTAVAHAPSTRRAAPAASTLVPLLAVAVAYVVGAILRYRFIFLTNRPTDPANIFGDVEWYVFESGRIFTTDFTPTLYDTLFPPGASIYIAAMRWLDPSLRLLVTSQWVLACLVPLLLGTIASRVFDRRRALYVTAFASLYFPLWEYFGYLFSEGPFLFTMYLSFLLLTLSLQARTTTGALIYGGACGLALGACAICKSVALFTFALIFSVLGICWLKRRYRLWPSVAAAALGVAVVVAPVSIRATWLNEGRFLLIANDASRTFLLGHQGRAGLTWWEDSERGFRMNFINPSTIQHNYGEEKRYPFGVYDNAANYAAGLKWTWENPLEALLLSVEHVFDMFTVALPYPGYFRPYSRWVIFFGYVFLSLVFLPALMRMAGLRRRLGEEGIELQAELMMTAAVGSIFIIAFLFLGEARYRICYDGFMILLASGAILGRNSQETRR